MLLTSVMFFSLVAIIVLLVVNAEVVRPLLKSRRAQVGDEETVASGRALLRDGRYFEIPISVPVGLNRLRLLFGAESGDLRNPTFAVDLGSVRTVHRDSSGVLVYVFGPHSRVTRLAFVYVTDPSTGRPSLLRVPPGITRSRQAVAWTFGMNEHDWAPLIET